MKNIDLRTALEALPLLALFVDLNNRIDVTNTAVRALLGQQIEGHNFGTMLRQPATLLAIENTLRDQEPRTAKYVAPIGAQDVTYSVTCRFDGGE